MMRVIKILRRMFFRIEGWIIKNYPEFLLSHRTKHFMLSEMDKPDHNEVAFRKDLNDSLESILSSEELNNPRIINKLTVDIVKCYLAYGITPDEFLLHSFQDKKWSYRRTILSRKRKDEICIELMGSEWKSFFNQLKDKWSFYSLAKPFFKRDVIRVDSTADFEDVVSFCAKHRTFIAKPRWSSSGIGVHKVDLAKWEKIDDLFHHYCNLNDGCWLFEEFIVQDPEMASWHPFSVNTIRIPSIMTPDGPVVILPLFRTGKNGNFVDNCHNDGGLMSVPDAKTGVIVSDGYDIYTNVVETHPNSGKKFRGYQVPRWSELIETAKRVHNSLPRQHKYVGFDFALTKDGWVLVEGNWGNFPHQVCVGYGIRREFERLMRS